MQTRQYDITDTILAVYSIQGLATREQPVSRSLTDTLWLIADPSGSICVIGAANASEWVYKVGSDYFALNDKLRDLILPPDRLGPSVALMKTSLRKFSHFIPNALRPVLPLHVLFDDAALLASRAQSTLKTGDKMKACAKRAGVIANETIVHEGSRQLQDNLHAGMEQAAHAAINTIQPAEKTKPAAPAPSSKSSSGWDALFGTVSQVAKSGAGTSLFQAATNQFGGSFTKGLVDTATAVYDTGDVTSVMKSTMKVVSSHAASKISTSLTEEARLQASRHIDAGVNQVTQLIDAKEKEYLKVVSTVIVDTTAKKILMVCLSTCAGLFSAAYVVPNVTSWGLSFFMGDAAAAMVTTGVKVIALGFTGKAAYSMVCTYAAKRHKNNEQLAEPMRDVENQIVEGLTSKVKVLLPVISKQSLFGEREFVSRCAKELPETFLETGNTPVNK
jgi:hypothetical protein